jgi:small subunit ribosomal protein S17
MQKTRIVRILRLSKHPKYSRIVRGHSKFKAHDEKNLSHTGDTVRIIESRPLSKDKYFRVAEILKKAEAGIELKEQV